MDWDSSSALSAIILHTGIQASIIDLGLGNIQIAAANDDSIQIAKAVVSEILRLLSADALHIGFINGTVL